MYCIGDIVFKKSDAGHPGLKSRSGVLGVSGSVFACLHSRMGEICVSSTCAGGGESDVTVDLPVLGITAMQSGSLRFDDIENLQTYSTTACHRVFELKHGARLSRTHSDSVPQARSTTHPHLECDDEIQNIIGASSSS